MSTFPTRSPKRLATTSTSTMKPAVQYDIEFFHIYTDEMISERHFMGLEYLRAAEQAWSFTHSRSVLVDNYNPKTHVITAEDVLAYLSQQQMMPDYWAYEADMVANAKVLIDKLTDNKLRKQYLRYIDQHQKYPCSLLTATWYLTRLGYLSHKGVIHATRSRSVYRPVKRLLNLLPEDYQGVEDRAATLIRKSEFADAAHRIQDLFYPISAGRSIDLF